MSADKPADRVAKLRDLINDYRYNYHVLNKSTMSEAAADSLKHELSQLEEKLAKSAEKLAEVNAALSEEIEKRLEVTAERDESQALAEKLKAKIRAESSD